MTFRVSNGVVINNNRDVQLGRFSGGDPGGPTPGTLFFSDELRTVRVWNGFSWNNLTQGAQQTQAWSWGRNLISAYSGTGGQLGDNTLTNRSSPVSVVGGFTDWTSIGQGGDHTLGTRSNGQLWGWGYNDSGLLGDNTRTTRSSPVSAVGGFTDWVQVSSGGTTGLNVGQAAGLRSNGQIWAMGNNVGGKLGAGFAGTGTSSPISVVGGFTDWIRVCVGFQSMHALRSNGQIWSWGVNSVGQLGTNDITDRSSPTSLVGGITDWIDISAGGTGTHVLAIRSNGTAWGWGINASGELGDNTITSRRSPVSVVGGFTDWIQVSAGSSSAGVRSNGQIWAWGRNSYGQLGDNTITSRRSPVSVVGGFTDWVQVSSGNGFTVALRSNGTAWAWGSNSLGALGDGTITNRSSPVSVIGGFTDWLSVSAGNAHVVGLRVTTI